jgi:hypothetical protein
MMFKGIMPVYCEIIIRNPQLQNEKLLTVKADDTYSYHWALKG